MRRVQGAVAGIVTAGAVIAIGVAAIAPWSDVAVASPNYGAMTSNGTTSNGTISDGAMSDGAMSDGATSNGATSTSVSEEPAADSVSMSVYDDDDFVDEAQSLSEGLSSALGRDLDLTPAEYLAQSAAATDAVEVVAALEDAGVDVTGSRLEGTTLVVNVGSNADTPAVEELGAVAEVGTPEAVDTSGLTFSPAVDVSGGEGYTWSTLSGSSQCSIGFPGYRISDGRPMAVTAGHCTNGMAGITGPITNLAQSLPGTNGIRSSSIGSPLGGASAFGGGFDGGLITLAPGVTPAPSVSTWGGGTGAPRASAPLPVTGMGAAIVGATLCKSGSRTGWSCGSVRAVDYTLNVGGSTVNSILASTCLQPGDSGGAGMIGQIAVGINSSTSSLACGASGYISGFFPMVSASGKASVQAQFGAMWEPAFSVSAAQLGSMTAASDGTMSTISGTVTGASSTSRVAVYAGASATPFTTVTASTGSWSVQVTALVAAGLGSGDHVLRFVAMTGARSSASPTEAPVSVSGNKIVAALLPSSVVTR